MKEYVLVAVVLSASGSTAWIARSWVVRGGPTPLPVRIPNQAQETVLVEEDSIENIVHEMARTPNPSQWKGL